MQEAYGLAMEALGESPADVWAQRGVGWALYYMIKTDAKDGDCGSLLGHIDELLSLDMLETESDKMIFENVKLQIGMFVGKHLAPADPAAGARLSAIFSRLKDFDSTPSKSHSFLLQNFIKFEKWGELADFIDWWNLENLMEEDYVPYVTESGHKMLTLAERAFIAKSKALLALRDAERTEAFLPELKTLKEGHPVMAYPDYYYGKLLLSLGRDAGEALEAIMPFARLKASEFWVWQLLAEVFEGDDEKQLACLLRAVNCRTPESFLGKVRVRLAAFYVNRGQYDFARSQIDAVMECYKSQGWREPGEIVSWVRQPWYRAAKPGVADSTDYMRLTDMILCAGADECVSVVTYVDRESRRSSMVYGHKQRMSQRLPFRTAAGDVLRIYYTKIGDERLRVLHVEKIKLPQSLDYARWVEARVDKRDDKDFAFLRTGGESCFVSPALVQKHGLQKGDNVRALIVFDFNRKKEAWNWTCVKMDK